MQRVSRYYKDATPLLHLAVDFRSLEPQITHTENLVTTKQQGNAVVYYVGDFYWLKKPTSLETFARMSVTAFHT